MGETTKIQWTDHTFNPWIGCTKVSDGCKHCYAEALDHRWGNNRWGPSASRERTSPANWKKPLAWDRAAKAAGRRTRVFCASLADVFDEHPSIAAVWRADLWKLIAETPHLDWLLLTKRPENIGRLVPDEWSNRGGWPFNIWLGTTVEDQAAARKRIPWLMEHAAPVRFLSVEPQIGPVDLTRIEIVKPEPPHGPGAWLNSLTGLMVGPDDVYPNPINWVIVGGESGPKARVFDLAWARELVTSCTAARVPVFVKQLGLRPIEDYVRSDDGRTSKVLRDDLTYRDKKGADVSIWPADLQVRQFPEVRHAP